MTLIIICGIPFAGKTTLSKKLAQDLGFARVDLDEVKCELFGAQIKDEQIDQAGWDRVFKKMYRQIEDLLKIDGVVHDTGNFTLEERAKIRAIATKLNKNFVTVFVDVPVAVARQRLMQNRAKPMRFNVSDENFDQAVKEMVPPTATENVIVYDTEMRYEQLLAELNKIRIISARDLNKRKEEDLYEKAA